MRIQRPFRISWRPIVLLLALCGVAAVVGTRGDRPAETSQPRPVETAIPAAIPSPDQDLVEVAPSPALPAGVVATEPATGHEGHGDECAQCLSEKKLATYREDYAALLASQAREHFETAAGEVPLLDACRRVAAEVIREWSFSDSRPVLPPDDVVEARKRELLDPVLATLPRKPEAP